MRSTRLWPSVSPSPDAAKRESDRCAEVESATALLEPVVIRKPNHRDQRNVLYGQKRGM